MQQVTFSQYEMPVKPVEAFGLIDPDDEEGKKPVVISYDSSDCWNATVESKMQDDFYFIPIDNNINILRTNALGKEETENRCDVAIHTKQSVCFIELKKQRQDFLQDAIKQIESTLLFFEDEITNYKYKKAYVCNTRHPQFNRSFKDTQSEFYKKHEISLRVTPIIKELK